MKISFSPYAAVVYNGFEPVDKPVIHMNVILLVPVCVASHIIYK